MKFRYINTAALSLIIWSTLTSPVYAYLDPGTGSLLLQGLLGGIAGAAVIIRIYWHKFVKWFGWIRSGDSDSKNESD